MYFSTRGSMDPKLDRAVRAVNDAAMIVL
jgi:hypothetical protein